MLQELQTTSRREQAKGGRRARIVDATYALLREVGISDLSVKMIADQAGVSPATVYNLFGTKAAVLERVYERDLAAFEKLVADAPSADSLDRIFDSLVIVAQLYRSDSRFYRSVVSMPNTNPADTELIGAVTRPRVAFTAEMVRAAIQDGHLRPDTDPVRVGAVMRHISNGALRSWVSNLITVDQLEQETIYGVAAILWPFATKATQQRLQKKLDAVASSPAVKRARVAAAR